MIVSQIDFECWCGCVYYTCFMFDSCDKLCVCACVCMHLRVNLYCWTVVAHRCKVFMCDWKNRDS